MKTKLLTLRQASDLIIEKTGKPFDRSRLYWRIVTNRLKAEIIPDGTGRKRYFVSQKWVLDNLKELFEPLKKTGRPLKAKGKKPKELLGAKDLLKHGLKNSKTTKGKNK